MNIETNRDGDVPVYDVDLDETTDQSMSYTVVASVADLTDRDPEDLELLLDSVDPDALDAFVDRANESSTWYRLAFRYEGYTVEIIEDRRLRLTPSEEAVQPARA